MNREEAINMLYGMRANNLNLDDAYTKDKYDALEMAIKALEQEPKILNTLDFAIDASNGDTNYFVGFRNGLRYSKSLIDGKEPQFESCTEQEPCEMTAEEYRQRMIQAFHNADTDELIAICVLPTEKEFEHLEWLLKNHYKKEPCGNAIDRAEAIKIANGYCHPANVAKELAKLPPVNPQPCEDAISRQYLIDIATKDGAYDYVSAQEIANAPSVTPQPKTGHCKDCKWWKDSDGTYCRGVHAESKCPINRKEVLEGNGYCYMFEPQERSDKG